VPIGSDGPPLGRSDIGSTRVSETTLPFQTKASVGGRLAAADPAPRTTTADAVPAKILRMCLLHRTGRHGSRYRKRGCHIPTEWYPEST
jgi:hypothetical protein